MSLCLTRKEEQTIELYTAAGERLGNIRITRARDGYARVVFDLPRNIIIRRSELTLPTAASTRPRESRTPNPEPIPR